MEDDEGDVGEDGEYAWECRIERVRGEVNRRFNGIRLQFVVCISQCTKSGIF